MTDGKTPPRQQGEPDKPLLKKQKFTAAVMADPELTAEAKIVAFVLMDILNNADGYARPGHKRIALQAGTNVTAVKRGLKALQGRGWFVVEPVRNAVGDQDPNRYWPIWKRVESPAPAGSERVRKAPKAKAVSPASSADEAADRQVGYPPFPF